MGTICDLPSGALRGPAQHGLRYVNNLDRDLGSTLLADQSIAPGVAESRTHVSPCLHLVLRTEPSQFDAERCLNDLLTRRIGIDDTTP